MATLDLQVYATGPGHSVEELHTAIVRAVGVTINRHASGLEVRVAGTVSSETRPHEPPAPSESDKVSLDHIPQEIRDIPIAEFLSLPGAEVRIRSLLLRHRIQTVGDLLQKSGWDLRGINHFGQKALEIVVSKLKGLGVTLQPDPF